MLLCKGESLRCITREVLVNISKEIKWSKTVWRLKSLVAEHEADS